MFAAGWCFHMTIGLSIIFQWHGTSAVEEWAQYYVSGGFSLARGTSNILIVIMTMLLMSFLVCSGY